MSADWTTCRVVRDRDGDLWFRGCDSDDLWTANTNYPDVFLTTDEVLTVFGPLAPVLNADGLPVWQPIEPGTVIKAGTRVRRPYLTDSGAVEHILPTDTPANDDDRDVYICHCQDEDERTFAAHLAHIVERAVREQIASEIEAAAECRSWIADSALIQGMREAVEIARGES